MIRLYCHVDPATIPDEDLPDVVHVYLYGPHPTRRGTGSIGNQAKDAVMRLGAAPRTPAVDLLSLSLAVTAADTFIHRQFADDSWARDIELHVPLARPQQWEPVRSDLESMLRFLTGDRWRLVLQEGGRTAPTQFEVNNLQRGADISKVDYVSLFSGGLDSGVATLAGMADGGRPLLVSHAYQGDADYQNTVADLLPARPERLALNANPEREGEHDTSMRSRSFNFLALGVLAADTISTFKNRTIEMRVPENGLIALNPPLTPRRVGSLSTRTTHPFYLSSMQKIIDRVGLRASIVNPFEAMTKGEMVRLMVDHPGFEDFASSTVSCGKWKRTRKQCGRCVPCLIRRASLYAANVEDKTEYGHDDLLLVLADEENRDDLVSMMTAVQRAQGNQLGRWVAHSGPMPVDAPRRGALHDVVRRGLAEVGTFLRDSGLKV